MGAEGPLVNLAREMRAMSLRFETLSEAQHAILGPLCRFAASQDFYLGGGTAVALYLGHRRSVDFDWFRAAEIEDPLVLAQQARAMGLALEGVQVAPGTLRTVISGVRASFFEYPYPLLSAPTELGEPPLKVASLDDLAPMKLAAVVQRGSRKDFIDLYAIALEHRPIEGLVELYRRKYSTGDIAHVLIGLTYFDNAEEEPSPSLLWDVSWKAIKRQFEQWVKGLAN